MNSTMSFEHLVVHYKLGDPFKHLLQAVISWNFLIPKATGRRRRSELVEVGRKMN
jgi:hypothetical protein